VGIATLCTRIKIRRLNGKDPTLKKWVIIGAIPGIAWKRRSTFRVSVVYLKADSSRNVTLSKHITWIYSSDSRKFYFARYCSLCRNAHVSD
jgi:hypothetical protein